MFNFLSMLWCLIGIIVGIIVLFLVIVGASAMMAEAVKQHSIKKMLGGKRNDVE